MKKEDIMRKIKNLLSRTTDNGATPEEMDTALKLAEHLMETYAISLEQVSNLEEKSLVIEGELYCVDTKNTSEFVYMAKELTNLFHCDILLINKRKDVYSRRRSTYIKFVGSKDCIEFCEFLLTEIYMNTLKCWLEFSKKTKFNRHEVLTAKYSFERGYYDGVNEKIVKLLNEQKKTIGSSCTSLVVLDNQVKNYMENLNLKAHSFGNKPRAFSSECYGAGHEKGLQQSLEHRVSRNNKSLTCN